MQKSINARQGNDARRLNAPPCWRQRVPAA